MRCDLDADGVPQSCDEGYERHGFAEDEWEWVLEETVLQGEALEVVLDYLIELFCLEFGLDGLLDLHEAKLIVGSHDG